MSISVSVSNQLRRTNKGRLSYERHLTDNKDELKSCIEKWTTPPRITPPHGLAERRSKSSLSSLELPISPEKGSSSTPKSIRVGSTSSHIIKQHGLGGQQWSVGLGPEIGAVPLNNTGSAETISQVDQLVSVYKQEDDNVDEKSDSSKEDTASSPNGLHLSAAYARAERVIKDYENVWVEKERTAVARCKDVFDENSRLLENDLRRKLNALHLLEERQSHLILQKVKDESREQSVELQRRQQLLKEHHQHHKQALEVKLKEAESKKHQLAEEAKRIEELKAQERMMTLKKHSLAASQHCDTMLAQLNNFLYTSYLPESVKNTGELVGKICAKMSDLLQQAQSYGVTSVLVATMATLAEQAEHAAKTLAVLMEDAQKKAEMDNDTAKLQQQEQELMEQERLQEIERLKQQQVISATQVSVHVNDLKAGEVLCVSERGFREYSRLKQNLEQVEKTLESFITDTQYKKLRMDLQKAVNIPVNAISPVNGSHMRDKLQRLSALLSGQNVEVGTKRVSAKDHPLAILFCKNLIAKMIVKKGEEQVSSKHDSAFAIGMTAVGLMCEHSDLTDLVLAQFHRMCPYIVPYHIPKQPGQSSEDHLKMLGYKFDGGKCEQQDKFLKRMSGLVYLYASIIVSTPPPKSNHHRHPYDVSHAWLWLCDILNMEPQPDITATLICDMLQVTGQAMHTSYSRQFLKVLSVLLTDFMQRIQQAAVSGGPVSRLQVFLEKCLRNRGYIGKPEGFLEQSFWNS